MSRTPRSLPDAPPPDPARPSRRALLGLATGLLLLGSGRAWADGPALSLDIDLRKLAQGETVTARVRVTNGVVRGVPALPAGSGLQVRYTGQSQQQVIVNFQSTRIVEFSFAVTALAEGSWSLGPAQVQVGNQTLTAPAQTIQVSPRSAQEQARNDVVGTISDKAPYLGQVVVYAFRHKHADRVLDMDWTPPTFDGFMVEKTAEATQRNYQVDEDGVTYGVEEIFQPLVATDTGPRTIPPAVLTVQVPGRGRSRNPFLGNVESRVLSSEPIAVTVRPLPAQGRPADFSGLVGSFHLQATARREGSNQGAAPGRPLKVALGESITQEITLSGDGSLTGATLPTPPAGGGYRVYDDAPDIQAKVEEGAFSAVATFRRAVVPTVEGRVTVDPVTVSVFDPQTQSYQRLRTDPLVLDVQPGEQGAGQVQQFGKPGTPTDERQDVQALGEDILPVPGGAHVRDHGLKAALPWAVGLPLLPAVGLVAMGVQALSARRRPDPRARLRGRMQGLPTEPDARLAALEDCFREACGLRLGRPAPGLDRAAIAGLGEEAAEVYEALTRARYGGFTPGGGLEAQIRAFVEKA